MQRHVEKLNKSLLFRCGFFRYASHDEVTITSECMICHRLAKGSNTSNYIKHLRARHPEECEKYELLRDNQVELDTPLQFETEDDTTNTNDRVLRKGRSSGSFMPPANAVIKSEKLEFVDVNQDDLFDTMDTWSGSDQFDESEHFGGETSSRVNDQSVSSSNYILPKVDVNDSDTIQSDDYSQGTAHESKLESSLLFRKGFYRLIRREGDAVYAKCLKCETENVKIGRKSNSNFLSHLKRVHPEDYLSYVNMRDSGEAIRNSRELNALKLGRTAFEYTQNDFERILTNFMITGMHPPRLLIDPTFVTLLNDIAMHRTGDQPSVLKYRLITLDELASKIDELVESTTTNIVAELKTATSISATVDICLSGNDKTLMIVTANWIDLDTFQRRTRLIACDVCKSSKSYEFDVNCKLSSIYAKFGIEKLILATTTNNIATSVDLLHSDDFLIENQRSYSEVYNLVNQIQCPTYLFKLVVTEDAAGAKNDFEYLGKFRTAFEKLEALQYHNKDNLGDDSIKILKEIFNSTTVDGQCISNYESIVNLIKFELADLNEIKTELGQTHWTEDDFNFLKEYVMILEPIVTTIEYLEKHDCFYATHLPMVYSTKNNLDDFSSSGKIQYCQALLIAIQNGLRNRFDHLFDFNNEKCLPAIIATCTHPFFKMRWLKGDMKTPLNTNLILDLLVQAAKNIDLKPEQVSTEAGNSNTIGEEPPAKKYKYSFDTSSDTTADVETIIQMDWMSFLKKPCESEESNLIQLKHHMYVQKLFLRYNSIPSACISMERNISISELIRKFKSEEFDDGSFSKLGIIRAAQ